MTSIEAQYALLEPMGMPVVVLDEWMVIRFLNKKARTLMSADSSSLTGRLIDELVATCNAHEASKPADLIQLINNINAGHSKEIRTTLSRPNGTVFIARVIVSKVDNGVSHPRYCLLIEDISASQHVAKELALSAQAFEHSGEPIMITDHLDRIVRVNASFTAILGYEQHEVLGKTPGLLREGLGEEDTYRAMWNQVSFSGQWSGEVFNRMKSGETFPSWLSITKIDQGVNAGHHISIFSDITSHMHEVNKLRHQVNHDFLTGLPNRSLFLDRLNQAIKRQKRNTKKLLAVLFIDLDGFKAVNDSLGHRAGDELLKGVASALRACVREEDTVCRHGGDEFLILLSEIKSERNIIELIQKLLHSLPNTPVVDEKLRITASIGASIFPTHGYEAEELISHADKAMYFAKSSGKNGYKIHSS